MSKHLAYLRTSTDKQDLNNQKLEILEYARQKGVKIEDFIALSMSSRKSQRERRIDELLSRLDEGDTLFVTELSRLGRSTGQVINLIDELVNNDIRIIVIKQNLTLDKTQDDICVQNVGTSGRRTSSNRPVASQEFAASAARRKQERVIPESLSTIYYDFWHQKRH